jgi:hypothetical protein
MSSRAGSEAVAQSANIPPFQAKSLRSPSGTLGAIQIGGKTHPRLPDYKLDAEERTFLAPVLDSGIPSISSKRDFDHPGGLLHHTQSTHHLGGR